MDEQPATKNNKKLITVGIIGGVVSLIIIGGVVFIKNSFSQPVEKRSDTSIPNEVLPTADLSINVDAKLQPDGHTVLLSIKNIPSDISSIEYEFSYNTGAGLPKGVLSGHPIDLSGKSEFSREILLGTCSRGKCVYDEGVKTVSLVVKFNGSKETSVFQKDFSL